MRRPINVTKKTGLCVQYLYFVCLMPAIFTHDLTLGSTFRWHLSSTSFWFSFEQFIDELYLSYSQYFKSMFELISYISCRSDLKCNISANTPKNKYKRRMIYKPSREWDKTFGCSKHRLQSEVFGSDLFNRWWAPVLQTSRPEGWHQISAKSSKSIDFYCNLSHFSISALITETDIRRELKWYIHKKKIH